MLRPAPIGPDHPTRFTERANRRFWMWQPGNAADMYTLRIATIGLVAIASVTGCASDEPTPTVDTPVEDEDVPFDPNVSEGVDTEVEQSENLGFDDDDS